MASLADGMWCVLVRNQSLGALELGIALSTYTPSTVMTVRAPVVLEKSFIIQYISVLKISKDQKGATFTLDYNSALYVREGS